MKIPDRKEVEKGSTEGSTEAEEETFGLWGRVNKLCYLYKQSKKIGWNLAWQAGNGSSNLPRFILWWVSLASQERDRIGSRCRGPTKPSRAPTCLGGRILLPGELRNSFLRSSKGLCGANEWSLRNEPISWNWLRYYCPSSLSKEEPYVFTPIYLPWLS